MVEVKKKLIGFQFKVWRNATIIIIIINIIIRSAIKNTTILYTVTSTFLSTVTSTSLIDMYAGKEK